MGKVVLASGVFDLIHYGHVRFLEEAKKLGGEGAKLVVVVARDKTVVKLKGKKPVMNEEERRALVEALKPVDEAILGFEEFSIGGIIERVKPDIIALGYDQDYVEKLVREYLREKGLNIQIVKLNKYGAGIDSSSELKKKVLDSAKP